MGDDRMEMICALLCLLTSLERCPEDPAPLSRRAVGAMLDAKMLDGLVLRENEKGTDAHCERARALLSRASAVYAAIGRYMQKGYRILLPGEGEWPPRLMKLGGNMPRYLFVMGNLSLLAGRTIAVAGSRAILRETKENAERIGAVLAGQRITVISGGAQGIDSAVQCAVLRAGGSVVIVPAVPVREILKISLYAKALEEGRLLIACDALPDEVFSPHKALSRNHTIYALGDCALVLASRDGTGGSWAGAKACLAGGWSPVYVLDEDGPDYAGNSALIEQGALRMKRIGSASGDELIFEGLSEAMLRRIGVSRQLSFDLEGI